MVVEYLHAVVAGRAVAGARRTDYLAGRADAGAVGGAAEEEGGAGWGVVFEDGSAWDDARVGAGSEVEEEAGECH